MGEDDQHAGRSDPGGPIPVSPWPPAVGHSSGDPGGPPGAPRFEGPGSPAGPTGPTGPTDSTSPTSPTSPTGGPPILVGPGEGGFDEARPRPRLPGVLAAAAGLLVLSSLAILIPELPEDSRRVTGLLLSLGFEALGLLALFLWQGRPAVAAGVVVSAIGVVPVLVFAFIDPNRPNIEFGSFSKGKGTLTGILLLSAVIWLIAYLVGPGRRFALFLGAALVSTWLLLLLQIATSSLEQVTGSGVPLTPDNGTGFGSDDSFGSASSTANSTSTRIGVVSLVVGLAYLLAARWWDRRGGARAATPFFATAAVILTVAVFSMVSPWKAEGASILAVALGAGLVWLGTTAGRRFTSWYGAFAVAGGMLALLGKLAEPNQTLAGLLVLAAGVALALLANWLTGRADPGEGDEVMTPLPAWTPPAGQ